MSAQRWSAPGWLALWTSTAFCQWFAASRTETPGTAIAPVEEPPAPAKRSVMVRRAFPQGAADAPGEQGSGRGEVDERADGVGVHQAALFGIASPTAMTLKSDRLAAW
jgi:hypothetical protein